MKGADSIFASLFSSELGVILANRSAALYHLERHERALEDIEEASRLGYPRDKLYKLEERRARCLLGLQRHDEAVEAFRRALGALDDAGIPLERRRKFEMDIRMMLAVMDEGKRLNRTAAGDDPPRSSGKRRSSARAADVDEGRTGALLIPEKKRNPLYPACSRALEIRDDGGDVGRHAIATREIAPGDIVIVERPHCAFLLAENRWEQHSSRINSDAQFDRRTDVVGPLGRNIHIHMRIYTIDRKFRKAGEEVYIVGLIEYVT